MSFDVPLAGWIVMADLPVAGKPRFNLHTPDVGPAVELAELLRDPIRAGILRMLADGECCVCEMAAALGARQNNVSNHLAKLRDAGLVRAGRHEANARFQYYERDEEAVARARTALSEVLR